MGQGGRRQGVRVRCRSHPLRAPNQQPLLRSSPQPRPALALALCPDRSHRPNSSSFAQTLTLRVTVAIIDAGLGRELGGLTSQFIVACLVLDCLDHRLRRLVLPSQSLLGQGGGGEILHPALVHIRSVSCYETSYHTQDLCLVFSLILFFQFFFRFCESGTRRPRRGSTRLGSST